MKLYLGIKEVQNDEHVKMLINELVTSEENQQAVNDLVKRVVQCANAHIWGMLIMMAQEGDE